MNNQSKRIIYVDIMRAFAVIMMIQGHTVDTFLAEEFRSMDSIGYAIWHTMRGFTAPIFMFTSGMIFTYLLKPDHYDFFENPRIKKGLKRGFLLILIGYLLRYPTYRIIDFTYVTPRQWDIFFAVDALHLIGVGLLFVISSVFISKRIHVNLNIIISIIITVVLISSPIITKIEWNNYLPQYLSSYLTRMYGSFFPIFPWISYVLSGALLGNYLYKNDNIFLKKRFSFTISVIGGTLVAFAMIMFSLQSLAKGEMSYWFFSNGIVFLRTGYVIIINGIIALVVRRFSSIPKIINETGKRTLLLYILHVVILYGCAWFPGIYKYYGKTFNPMQTAIAAIVMMGLMLAIVQFSERFSMFTRNGFTFLKKLGLNERI